MAHDTKVGQYYLELEQRVRDFFESLRSEKKLLSADEFDTTFAFVKEIALESWKNGLAAGRKRAARPDGERRRTPKVTE